MKLIGILSDLWERHFFHGFYWTETVTLFFVLYLYRLGFSPDTAVITENWTFFLHSLFWSVHEKAEGTLRNNIWRFRGLDPLFGNLLYGEHNTLDLNALQASPGTKPDPEILTPPFSYARLRKLNMKQTGEFFNSASGFLKSFPPELRPALEKPRSVLMICKAPYGVLNVPSWNSASTARLQTERENGAFPRGRRIHEYGYFGIFSEVAVETSGDAFPRSMKNGFCFRDDLMFKWYPSDTTGLLWPETSVGIARAEGDSAVADTVRHRRYPVFLNDLMYMSAELSGTRDDDVIRYWRKWLETDPNPFGKDLSRYLGSLHDLFIRKGTARETGIPIVIRRALQYHNWNEYFRRTYSCLRPFRTNFNRIRPDLVYLAAQVVPHLDGRSVAVLDSLLPVLSSSFTDMPLVWSARKNKTEFDGMKIELLLAVAEQMVCDFSASPERKGVCFPKKKADGTETKLVRRIRRLKKKGLPVEEAESELFGYRRNRSFVADYFTLGIRNGIKGLSVTGRGFGRYRQLHDDLMRTIRRMRDGQDLNMNLIPEKSVFNGLDEILGEDYVRLRTYGDLLNESDIQHNCISGYRENVSGDCSALYTHIHDGLRYSIEFRCTRQGIRPVQVLSKYNRTADSGAVIMDIMDRMKKFQGNVHSVFKEYVEN